LIGGTVSLKVGGELMDERSALGVLNEWMMGMHWPEKLIDQVESGNCPCRWSVGASLIKAIFADDSR
jgi:uncharacterized protein YodC (DUF2158 family)